MIEADTVSILYRNNQTCGGDLNQKMNKRDKVKIKLEKIVRMAFTYLQMQNIHVSQTDSSATVGTFFVFLQFICVDCHLGFRTGSHFC